MTRTTPPLSDLLSDTFKNVQPYYWKLVKISLLGMLVVLPLSIPLIIFATSPEESFLPYFIISFVVLSVVSFFIQMWMKLTGQRTILKKGALGVFESYRGSFKLISALFWMLILMFLILIPSFIAFIVPYVILIVHVYFADWYIANGEARGLTALAKSRELSRGIFWQTAWKIFFPILVIGACSFGISYSLLGIVSDYSEQIVSTLLNGVFSIFATPVLLQYNYELFTALKRTAKKESPKQIQFYKVLAIIGTVLMALFLALVVFVFLMANS